MSQKSKWEYFKAIYQRYRKGTFFLHGVPVCFAFQRSSPPLSAFGSKPKVSQTLLKEKMPSSFELIHSSASRKRFSLARDGLKK